MAGKTRKQRGRGLANLFRKKAPLSSSAVNVNRQNNSITYKRKGSLTNFLNLKKRKAFAAKTIRNHVQKLKSVSNNVRASALSMMNANTRAKTQQLLNVKNFNSLSNDQVLELYNIGKLRSLSH